MADHGLYLRHSLETVSYGCRFAMELLYLPLLAGCDWGTRGGLPLRRLAHRGRGLPVETGFRAWHAGPARWYLEAVNMGNAPVSWDLAVTGREAVSRAHVCDAPVSTRAMALAPQGTIEDVIT